MQIDLARHHLRLEDYETEGTCLVCLTSDCTVPVVNGLTSSVVIVLLAIAVCRLFHIFISGFDKLSIDNNLTNQ